jgi:PITH domain
MSHSHDHYDGADPIDHSHDHDHDHTHDDDVEPALQNHLYTQVDFDKITCLNETSSGLAKSVIKKTWMERLELEPELQSDVDEQLIISVPYVLTLSIFACAYKCRFTGQVRLQTILLRSSDSPLAPSTLFVFPNKPSLDFETASELSSSAGSGSQQVFQKFELPRTSEVQKIAVKRSLFNACTSVTLFFQSNFAAEMEDEDEEETRISYIGFAGEFMRLVREPVSVAYEAAANPKDHVLMQGIGNQVGSNIGAGGKGF